MYLKTAENEQKNKPETKQNKYNVCPVFYKRTNIFERDKYKNYKYSLKQSCLLQKSVRKPTTVV